MKSCLTLLIALLATPAFASTGNSETMDGSAAFLLQYLLYPEQNEIDGAAEIPACFAKFRSLTIGIDYVNKLTSAEGGADEFTYAIVGTANDGKATKMVLYVNYDLPNGFVSCEVDKY